MSDLPIGGKKIVQYQYITENNLYDRQKYNYSQFGGHDFLDVYIKSRELVIDELGKSKIAHNTREELIKLKNTPPPQLLESAESYTCLCHSFTIDSYVKSFEVRKRIYECYDDDWRPCENASFEKFDLYLVFADCLILYYDATACTKYLSCLLKLDDTLISIRNHLTISQNQALSHILQSELKLVRELSSSVNVEV